MNEKPSSGEQQLHHTSFVNLSTDALIDRSLIIGVGELTQDGAFVVTTGEHTGRSPKDKYVVPSFKFAKDLDLGEVNTPLSKDHFNLLLGDVWKHLSNGETYEENLLTGADKQYARHVRLLTSSPWHAAFTRHLLIEPSPEWADELHKFSAADITIYHAPEFFATPDVHHTKGKTAIAIDFDSRTIVICGTSYAGEIKKAVFSYMQGVLPEAGVATMHCAATTDQKGENTVLYFGLSGTGKTTLSQDVGRRLVGDDEHGWGKNGIFNLEGGCYPKVINLNETYEPEIYKLTNGRDSILENVIIDSNGVPDFSDQRLTENTRSAFSIQQLEGWKGVAPAPKQIIFLTADATGVLPPVARLTPEQAMYYLLSGYTSKVAGTEKGVKDPELTFSSFFGAPFLPLKPDVYAKRMSEKLNEFHPAVWLVNTGWSGEAHAGGSFDAKKRMSLPTITRPIIRAITSGQLADVPTKPMDVFGLYIPQNCPGVDPKVLQPQNSWQNAEEFQKRLGELAKQFQQNFAKKFSIVPDSIRQAGPQI